MIDAGGNHLIDALLLRSQIALVGKMAERLLPPDRFFPDQKAQLVAQVEKALVLRIMRTADEIGAQLAHLLQVRDHQRRRLSRAKLRMKFMAADPLQLHRDVVEKNLVAMRADASQSEANLHVVIRRVQVQGV